MKIEIEGRLVSRSIENVRGDARVELGFVILTKDRDAFSEMEGWLGEGVRVTVERSEDED